MLDGLKLINCPPSEALEQSLKQKSFGQCFVLRTCQRTLLVGFNRVPESLLPVFQSERDLHSETFKGLEAYEFLLKTICGLKSKILGESEIVHQFKEAYQEFLNNEKPNRLIQTLLEKLFKDAKEIRTQHLKNIGLQTYAGITRQIFMEKTGPKKNVLVLGSGNLAEDFIKITQRNFNLTLCARNEKRVQELRMKYSIEIHGWDSRHTLGDFKNVVNTIGSDGPLVSGPQSKKQNHNLFVDLAEPSPFRHLLDQSFYWSLEDIFEYSKLYGEKKKEKVEKATQAIKEVAEKRKNHFVLNLPFGWEELQFA